MPMGSPDLRRNLTAVLTFLSTSPWFPEGHRKPAAAHGPIELLAVCGNWYDVPHKAQALASAISANPDAEILLTGGRDERLTSPKAVEMGGEPLELRAALHERHGVPLRRISLWTGSRVTNHNLLSMLGYAKQLRSWHRRRVRLRIFEEAFLVRREAASLHALLAADPEARGALSGVAFQPVGPTTFGALAASHGQRADVALALLLGEVDRLERYSTRGKQLVLPTDAPLAAQHGSQHLVELARSLALLRARPRTAALLASGAVLYSTPARGHGRATPRSTPPPRLRHAAAESRGAARAVRRSDTARRGRRPQLGIITLESIFLRTDLA